MRERLQFGDNVSSVGAATYFDTLITASCGKEDEVRPNIAETLGALKEA